uniref:NADH dehydrogenase subunit 5 n=1 Tax=Charcotia amundseni TaxID=2259499 RepID=UPI001FF5168C|nr:NADH dehydrogenase subunit 5 [Charcotia amundseni]UIN24685.1 NADH dehydrogenase subunit 5 [Charcotia amundseni]
MKLNKYIYSFLTGVMLLVSLLLYMAMMSFYLSGNSLYLEWEISAMSSVQYTMSMIFDWMSLCFLSSVCLISGCILKYSEYYMGGEKNYLRFVFILMVFVISMLFLIISPNMVSILLGWDGLGLSSYALVIFYQNESSCNAGMLTVLSNRIGDVAILMSIGYISYMGSYTFLFAENYSGFILFLVVLAALTKSAQIPFSAWLPAAMAAPTPVSALVHSSTLVTAGVYLLIRFSGVLMEAGFGIYILMVGVMTMFMAGLNANFEVDMKKVIALSTLSQLGLMMMTLGLGLVDLAFYHLIMHAMFKSSLFMCAGVIIHSSEGYQDSRMMSGLSVSSPLLCIMFCLTNMALAGFPFLSGFYSKDVILEMFYMVNENIFLVGLISLSTGMTVAYSLRVIYLSMNSISNMKSISYFGDIGVGLVKSMFLLFFMSLVLGYLFSWWLMENLSIILLGSLDKYFTLLMMFMGGLLISIYLGKMMFILSAGKIKYSVFMVLSYMWFLPFLSTKNLIQYFLGKGGTGFSLLDLGWLEYYGGQGGQGFFMNLSNLFQTSQRSVMISSYLMGFVLFIWLNLSYIH